MTVRGAARRRCRGLDVARPGRPAVPTPRRRPGGAADRRDRQLPRAQHDRAGAAATDGVDGRGDRSARRQRPRAAGDRRVRRRGRRRPRGVHSPTSPRPASATGCVTCASSAIAPTTPCHGDDRRAATSTARTATRRRGPTSAMWGARVADGGTMLIHDSFSSVGVTLAIMPRAAVRARGSATSAARGRSPIYRADLAPGWPSRSRNAGPPARPSCRGSSRTSRSRCC